MKKFLAAAMAALLLFTVPGVALAAEEEREVPDGYVETTFCDLTYVVPEEWDSWTSEEENQASASYNLVKDQEYNFPLDVHAYDAITTLTDMALFDMLVMGEIDPEETRADKLERWGKTELRTKTVEETEVCDIEGVDAVKFVVTTPTGWKQIRYDLLTDGYYYKFEFTNNEPEITDEFAEIIDQVMNSIIVTPEEPAE